MVETNKNEIKSDQSFWQFTMKYVLVLLVAVFGAVSCTSTDLCDIQCSTRADPVCATNGQIYLTFRNACDMLQEFCRTGKHWSMVEMKKCRQNRSIDDQTDLLEKCMRPCTDIYAPVCGSDGDSFRIFASPCVFEFENCMTRQKWHTVRMTDCNAHGIIA